ncbi:MAG: class I SAM-dependent rRNA methyltransferase [Clostridiales bacterium]|nr:class I SAM-dependent rRNA methyltransferase [Clostridiales bacterium]
MKIERKFPKITVTDKAVRALKGGHPWVFADEIISVDGSYENSELVDVFSLKNRYMGTGFINDNSKIRVRVISKNANDKFDLAFWERRIRYAIDYRKTVMGKDFNCCRLIFGEADQFPGLTVDRFGTVLVTQCLSLGIDRIKDVIYKTIIDVLREMGETIDVLYERNDVKIREKEGLEEYKAFYEYDGLKADTDGKTIITENSIKYNVDYINGQKTGFFLDQKYNRLAAAKIAKGRKVLDCFTHTGAFALNCAAGGAESVTAVDVSKDAIEMTKLNAEMNGFSNIDFLCCDVFELLTKMAESGKCPYDYIILDPLAFTKSSATVKNAERGYKEINMKAMKLLPRGGYLSTCSCSHFMKDELFRKMLHSAAADAGVELRQIEARQQAPDHPILWNVPETDYLKFYIFQVV